MTPERTFVALVHHPVYDPNRKIIATSLTNLDLHDIARSARTYGLAGFFIVHPVDAQRALAQRILGHWTGANAAEKNDFRRMAIDLVHVVRTLEEADQTITARLGEAPVWVATAASSSKEVIEYQSLRESEERPVLLVLGTGWGLSDEILSRCPKRLAPVRGPTDYNHLSVRSACAIMLDRLYGDRHNHAP